MKIPLKWKNKKLVCSIEYKIFKIKSYESIFDIFLRFINIINDLNLLKKSYTNVDPVKKILRFLSRSWKTKVIAIQESKDLNQLFLEELLSSLITHKQTIMNQQEENHIKIKKILAFKSSNQKENIRIQASDDKSKDLSLITRNLETFWR